MEYTNNKNARPAVLHWTVNEDQPRPAALRVVLHKRDYILPWSRFIYAEGSNDEVTISFPTHRVVVNGYGLDHLLADIASLSVIALNEPHRAERFRPPGEPEAVAAITSVAVRAVSEEV